MRNGEHLCIHFASYIPLSKKEENSDLLDSALVMNSTTLILKLLLVILTNILLKLLLLIHHTHSKLCNTWSVRYNMVEELQMLLIENS